LLIAGWRYTNLMCQYAAVWSWSLSLMQVSLEGRETKYQWEKAGTELVQWENTNSLNNFKMCDRWAYDCYVISQISVSNTNYQLLIYKESQFCSVHYFEPGHSGIVTMFNLVVVGVNKWLVLCFVLKAYSCLKNSISMGINNTQRDTKFTNTLKL